MRRRDLEKEGISEVKLKTKSFSSPGTCNLNYLGKVTPQLFYQGKIVQGKSKINRVYLGSCNHGLYLLRKCELQFKRNF